MTKDIHCIIVHHRNYPDVLETVASVHGAGIPYGQISVVDNSEDRAILSALQNDLHPDVTVLNIRNAGYAAAVNFAVEAAQGKERRREFTLVATHEVRVRSDAVRLLQTALEADPDVAVAGPTLLLRTTGEPRLWCTGGYLSKGLNVPAFHDWGMDLVVMEGRPITEREWLDGAFCLYRTEVIEREQFDTAYFLYYEETDLHVRLRKLGYKVVWVPRALVEQRSGGVPRYYWARNLQYFQTKHGRLHQRLFTVPYLILKNLARTVMRRPTSASTVLLVRAWSDALRPPFAVGWRPIARPSETKPQGAIFPADRR